MYFYVRKEGNVLSNKCPHCGAEVPEEAKFCLACFRNIDPSAQKARSVPLVKRNSFAAFLKKRGMYIAASIIVLIGFITALSIDTNDGSAYLSYIPEYTEADDGEFGGGVLTEPAGALPAPGNPVTVTGQAGVPEAVTQPEQNPGLFDMIRNFLEPEKTEPANTLPSENGYALPTPTDIQPINNGGSAGDNTAPTGRIIPVYPTQRPAADSQPGGSENGITGENGITETQNVTEATEPATTQKAPEVYVADPSLWEYKDYNKKGTQAELTKYNGTQSTVVVPAVIDGKKVVSLGTDALRDNGTLKTLRFDSQNDFSFLWIEKDCIKNCPNLEIIHFPDTDLGVKNSFASDVPKLASVTFANDQWRALNGCIYYYNGMEWYLRYVCPGCKNEVLDVPRWCISFESPCYIEANPYLKRVNIHEALRSLWNNSKFPPNLEEINVDPTNPYLVGSGGAAFQKNGGVCWLPLKNSHKELFVPDGCTLYLTGDYSNTTVETVRFASTAKLNNLKYLTRRIYFKSLKTVYIQKGSALENDIKGDFPGDVYMYD